MKTAATIFLLVLMVSVQTPAGQLFKLPLLIEHFIKHRQQDHVSLTGFLYDHYASQHHDADQPADEQLPFKNITFYTSGYAILPGVFKTNALQPLLADQKIIYPRIYLPQLHAGSIFHPPRT